MKRKWEIVGDYSVEIWFRIEKDRDGYPRSKEWEQLLAKPIFERDDYFQIESIPFYLKNVSWGDIVKARTVKNPALAEAEVFEFESVVERGGHNTYRLLLRKKRPDDPEFTVNELIDKGLSVEEERGDFLAVDVPPSVDQQAVDRYLVSESQSGRWEMQDGCLQTIETKGGP
jgi:hypothetical protein